MAVLAGSSSAEIDAPIEQVWKAVEDVEKAPDWQGGMKDLTAIETDDQGRPTLVETEADAKVTTIKTNVRFTYDGPTRLSWEQEKGDLKSLVGSWELEDLGDGRARGLRAGGRHRAGARDARARTGRGQAARLPRQRARTS